MSKVQEIQTEIHRSPRTPEITSTNNELPSLTITPTTQKEDLITSLHLVSDSIAQQHQQAAKTLLSHSISLGTMFTSLVSVVGILVYKDANWETIGTTVLGCMMVFLVGVRWVVGGYLEIAEGVGSWEWLYGDVDISSASLGDTGGGIGIPTLSIKTKENHDENAVLVMKFRDIIIGTIVLRATLSSASENNDKTKRTAKIRAWTIHNQYRGHKLGTALLNYAIGYTQERNWDGLAFDDHHANSARILPKMFNGQFEARESWARGVLRRERGC